MEKNLAKWQPRVARAEAELASTFRFENSRAALVVVDANYWTFGDRLDEIPEDYYSDPASAFRCQMDRIERHFHAFPDDDYVPFLHPWYGTGVLASAFGTKVILNFKADPAVAIATMQSPEEIDALPVPVPGLSGAMPIVTRMIRHFLEAGDLPVGFTDCQGPLATAFQVVGYDKFCYWMQDDPARIHALMEKISDALIAWVAFQKALCGQPREGGSWPLSIKLPAGSGGVWLSDDDSVIMGGGLYAEFVKPYIEKILLAFGGGCVHYCGSSVQNIDNYRGTKGITAISNFTLDGLEAAARTRRALREKGIAFMASDFVPSDARLDDYYRELAKAMDGPEGLVVCPYVAPAIALDKGKYEAIDRDRGELARRACESICRHFGR